MYFELLWDGEGPGDYDFSGIALANGEEVKLTIGHHDYGSGRYTWWVTFKTPHFWDGIKSIGTMKRCFETYTNRLLPRTRHNFRIRMSRWSATDSCPVETELLGLLEDWDKELIKVITILKRGRGKKPDPQIAEARRMLETLRDELKP